MFVRRGCAILRDKQPDDQQPGGGGNEPTKPGLSDEQKTEIGQIVNAAVTSQLGRAIPKALEGLKLNELIGKAIKEAMPAQPPPSGDPPKNEPPKQDPKVALLEENLKALTKKLEEADEARKAAEKKSRDDGARLALRGALEKTVRPEALEMATRLLFDADKRITFDDSGNPLFTIRRAPYAGAAEEDVAVPLADGAQHWLKSDEAKLFLPPPSASAPGSRGPSKQAPANRQTGDLPRYDSPAATEAERLRRAQEAEAAFRARFNITD